MGTDTPEVTTWSYGSFLLDPSVENLENRLLHVIFQNIPRSIFVRIFQDQYLLQFNFGGCPLQATFESYRFPPRNDLRTSPSKVPSKVGTPFPVGVSIYRSFSQVNSQVDQVVDHQIPKFSKVWCLYFSRTYFWTNF